MQQEVYACDRQTESIYRLSLRLSGVFFISGLYFLFMILCNLNDPPNPKVPLHVGKPWTLRLHRSRDGIEALSQKLHAHKLCY